MSRPDHCSNCGASARSHTGSYCQECGQSLFPETKVKRAFEAQYPYNGWLAMVVDEPIAGVPSHRHYGPFESSEQAWEALAEAGLSSLSHLPVHDHHTIGVLPLRQPAQMTQER